MCIARTSADAQDISIISVDAEFAKESCDEQGGVFFGESGWMLHVWPLDGLTPPEGPFAESNSLVMID